MANFAMAGCDTGHHNWDTWWAVVAGVHFWFGLMMLLGPSNFLPVLGKWKYLMLHPFAGLKDVTEHDWDPLSVAAAHGAATNTICIAIFALWAMDLSDLTFATVVVASEGVAVLSWIYVYLRYKDDWKWTIFMPLNGHLAMLALAAIMLADYPTDERQLVANNDTPDQGHLLWSIVAVRAFYTVLWLYDALVEDNSPFYLKTGMKFESRLGNAFLVYRAVTSVQVALLTLWGPLHFDGTDQDYTFPLAFWVGVVGSLLPGIFLICSAEDMWAPHFIILLTACFTASSSVTIAMWYTDCFDN